MTYKDTVDMFRILLKGKEGVPKLDDKEIFILLSTVQSEIQNRWKPTVANKQVPFVSGQDEYNLSSEAVPISPVEVDGGYGDNYGQEYGTGL